MLFQGEMFFDSVGYERKEQIHLKKCLIVCFNDMLKSQTHTYIHTHIIMYTHVHDYIYT